MKAFVLFAKFDDLKFLLNHLDKLCNQESVEYLEKPRKRAVLLTKFQFGSAYFTSALWFVNALFTGSLDFQCRSKKANHYHSGVSF